MYSVLIHDEKNNAVAAIHAGWRGTDGKIVAKVLLKMQENYGTNAADCKAYIGACIGYENFEVGKEVAGHFDKAVKMYNPEKQKWFVDLKNANQQQLLDAGVRTDNIEVSPYCTFKAEELFFSHRRDKGITGRMMAVIGMTSIKNEM